jgi:hypothetical protein
MDRVDHTMGQDADVKIAAAAMHGIFCYSAGGSDLTSQYSLSLSLPQRLLLACCRVTKSVSRADVLQLALLLSFSVNVRRHDKLVASYDVLVKALIDNTVRRGPEVKSLLRQAVKRVAQYSIEKEASDDNDDEVIDDCCWRGRVPAEVEALIEDKKTRLSADRCTTLPITRTCVTWCAVTRFELGGGGGWCSRRRRSGERAAVGGFASAAGSPERV